MASRGRGSFGIGGIGWRLRAATRLRRSGRSDRGMVTMELAMALPALVVAAVCLAWLLSLAVTQVVVAHAAREGARAAARGETAAQVHGIVARLAPGASVEVRRSRGLVLVRATVHRDPPIRLLTPLARDVRASSTSWWEQP